MGKTRERINFQKIKQDIKTKIIDFQLELFGGLAANFSYLVIGAIDGAFFTIAVTIRLSGIKHGSSTGS